VPTYTVRDPKTGKTLRLTGESPPTAQELEQIFGAIEAPPAPTSRPVTADLAIGAGKGAANTTVGMGDLFYRYIPGVQALSDAVQEPVANAINWARGVESAPGSRPVGAEAFGQARQAVQPTNTAQRIGFGAEQIGEFFLPTGAVGKLGTAAEIAKAGTLTMAQGGSGTDAGVSAALTAAVPGASALARASRRMQTGAEKAVVQALGPTKEAMKAEAARIAPEMIRRGVRGSRAQMLDRATTQVDDVGRQIGAAVQEAAQAGETVSGLTIRRLLRQSSDTLLATTEAGTRIPIEGTQPVLAKLRKLETFVAQLGDDIPYDQAQRIKVTFDRLVHRAGLYGAKAGASATDNASGWATREAATAFRDLLNRGNPTLEALNQEYRFWKGLKDVLRETERRSQAHGGGLIAGIGSAAGAAAGAASGESVMDSAQNAAIGGLVGRKLPQLLQSPAWRTRVSAPMKQMLADALASGNAERVSRAVGRIVAATPAQLRTQTVE